jgi:hypothetical protein
MQGRVLAAVGVAGVADWLFYAQPMGLSLAIFAAGLIVLLLGLRGGPLTRWDGAVLGAVALSLLPVVEKLQPLSVAFLVAGVTGGGIALSLGPTRWGRLGVAAGRLLASLPWRAPQPTPCLPHGPAVWRTGPLTGLASCSAHCSGCWSRCWSGPC